MGDGNVRRIAVVVNGDTEIRHLENVERATKVLKQKGFEVHVLSPQRPSAAATTHGPASKSGLETLVKGLEGIVDDDDELFFYTTGHGDKKGDGCLVLQDGCLAKDDPAFARLFALPHGKRTVVMSQCFAGNWINYFSPDPKTLFISAGSKDERVCCQNFDPFIFADDKQVPDINRNGSITWQERFGFGAARQQTSVAVFLRGSNYADTGIRGTQPEPPHFQPRVHEATTPEEYEKLLKGLSPGDVAVVDFSAPWCGPCQKYKPTFEALAKQSGGRALFIHIPNADDERWLSLQIERFPTIRLVDHNRRSVDADDRNNPLSTLHNLSNQHTEIPHLPPVDDPFGNYHVVGLPARLGRKGADALPRKMELTSDEILEGILFKKGARVVLGDNGRVKDVTLSVGQEINGPNGMRLPCARGTHVHFYTSGELSNVTLSKDKKIGDAHFVKGTELSFRRTGKVGGFYPPVNREVRGPGGARIQCLGGKLVDYYENGALREVTLAKRTAVQGVFFASGTEIAFTESGRLDFVVSAAKQTVTHLGVNIACKEGTALRFDEGGRIMSAFLYPGKWYAIEYAQENNTKSNTRGQEVDVPRFNSREFSSYEEYEAWDKKKRISNSAEPVEAPQVKRLP